MEDKTFALCKHFVAALKCVSGSEANVETGIKRWCDVDTSDGSSDARKSKASGSNLRFLPLPTRCTFVRQAAAWGIAQCCSIVELQEVKLAKITDKNTIN